MVLTSHMCHLLCGWAWGVMFSEAEVNNMGLNIITNIAVLLVISLATLVIIGSSLYNFQAR